MSPVVCVNAPNYEAGESSHIGGKSGTVGQPLPGVAMKVDGEGLLLVKGPNRMLGYLGQPERTAEVMQDGWYVTGDVAAIDEEGFVRITDRLSRFSKIGGEKGSASKGGGGRLRSRGGPAVRGGWDTGRAARGEAGSDVHLRRGRAGRPVAAALW
jgi:hypothetical protein